MYSLGDDAANGLHAPAGGVVDVASLPQNEGGDDPGPEELPEHTGPPGYLLDSPMQDRQLTPEIIIPFPASTHLDQLLHGSAVDRSARNTPRAVPLARDEPHQEGEEDLEGQLDNANEERGGPFFRT